MSAEIRSSDEPPRQEELPPAARILDITHTAFVTHRCLYVAAKLGIADMIADDSSAADELARATGTDARSLYRILRALASSGVLAESSDHQFRLTPLGATLRSDAPDSMRAWVLYTGEPWNLQAWQEIIHSVRTGKAAWDKAHGMAFFDYLARNPEASAIFDEALTSISRWDASAVTAAYDFSTIRKLVDVGGGRGELLATILTPNPHLNGVLYDQPHVVGEALKLLEDKRLVSRCEVIAGSFFESVPPGGDAYILKYVIHDWDDERSLVILRNCRRAMGNTGRLLLVELVVPPPGESHLAKTSDVEMLVILGSPERTAEEYRNLLARAGFRMTRIVPTREPMSIIEGVPV